MIFTAYEHTTNVGALVVCGDHVVCYTADDKIEPAKLEKHIEKLLTANGFGEVQVKVMKDMKNYLNRIKDICAKQEHLREGLKKHRFISAAVLQNTVKAKIPGLAVLRKNTRGEGFSIDKVFQPLAGREKP